MSEPRDDVSQAWLVRRISPIAKALDRCEEDVSTRLFVRDQYPGAYPTLLGNIAVSQARVIPKSMEDGDRTFLQARDALNMSLGPGKW